MRRRSARHSRCAQHDLHAWPGQVGKSPDTERIARPDRDLQDVRGEDLWRPVREVGDRGHGGFVGGGENVNGSALPELGRQRRRAVEGDRPDRDTGVVGREFLGELGEGCCERGRGEDRELTGERVSVAGSAR